MNQKRNQFDIRTWPYEEKIFAVVKNGDSCAFAYKRLQLHLKAATIEMERIWAYVASMPYEPEPSPSDPDFQAIAYEWMDRQGELYVPLLTDIHFYFVEWANIQSMMEFLGRQAQFGEANKVYNSHRKTLDHYSEGRNSFEHYHDRLAGKKRRQKLAKPDIGFSLQGGYYTAAGSKWDISPESLAKLILISDKFLHAIHRAVDDAIDDLQQKRGSNTG